VKAKETTPERTFQLEVTLSELESILDGLHIAETRYDHQPNGKYYLEIKEMIATLHKVRGDE
jgi:hypothetical protein